MSMPSGKILTRIDGPDDRAGWAFASDDLAYYAVTSYSAATTVLDAAALFSAVTPAAR